MFVDEKFLNHPKIFKAAKHLGPEGPALAIAVYLTGLAYAREQLTDGYIPESAIAACGVCSKPLLVGKALAARGVSLWHRRRNGWQIHDFEDHNRSRKEIIEIREKWRKEKAAQRRGVRGQFRDGQDPMSAADSHRDSRARGTGTSTKISLSRDPGSSTASVLTGRFASGNHKPRKTPTHRILCSMISAELEAGATLEYADVVEGVKVRIARQGFQYPTGPALESAIESVARARRRRRAS